MTAAAQTQVHAVRLCLSITIELLKQLGQAGIQRFVDHGFVHRLQLPAEALAGQSVQHRLGFGIWHG
ncbi:hypothetical protein EKPJFOCH_0195 [Methylobacterium thuringiense]|uniref:Uncharacterized protein n=1 Tax=Methylobacterium thuringiense TaxID=1003091 RepID=A0ABQ4TEC5_9HYPH|nr:hypothetical protein EKPJFOCH_0195 [Methylobacterium thuringiense]